MFDSFIKFGYDIVNYLDWEKISYISSAGIPTARKVATGVKKKISNHHTRANANKFNKEEEFWASILGSQFYGQPPENIQKIINTRLIQLKNFTLSEWIPWSPGRYWTKVGFEYRKESYFNKETETNGKIIFTPTGKSCATLGGLGTTRFGKIFLEDKEYKLLSATSSSYAERGIPILMEYNLYKEMRSQISEPTIKANIIGIFEAIPRELETLFNFSTNIPKSIIKINDTIDVKKLYDKTREGDKVFITPWTIFAHKRDYGESVMYNSCFCTDIDSSNNDSIINASEWIENDYIHKHNGKILTEFDENVNRFSEVSLRLSDVMSGQYNKLRIVIETFLEHQKNRQKEEIPNEVAKALEKYNIPYHL